MNRILADENIPRASVEFLRTAGLDVLWMAEYRPGAPDPVVLEIARSDDRLLISFDRDHGELVFRHGLAAPRGIVLLRFVPPTPEEPGRIVQRLLLRDDIPLLGHFTVVMLDQVRQRPLP